MKIRIKPIAEWRTKTQPRIVFYPQSYENPNTQLEFARQDDGSCLCVLVDPQSSWYSKSLPLENCVDLVKWFAASYPEVFEVET